METIISPETFSGVLLARLSREWNWEADELSEQGIPTQHIPRATLVFGSSCVFSMWTETLFLFTVTQEVSITTLSLEVKKQITT